MVGGGDLIEELEVRRERRKIVTAGLKALISATKSGS